MTLSEDYETQVYTYTTIAEMMTHMTTMSTNGFSMVQASSVSLKASYRKNM
jgi:hypothetical protein